MTAGSDGHQEPGAGPLTGHHKYQFIRDLNKGSYGFVQLVRDKETNRVCAVKFLERGDRINERYVGREIYNHSQLLHPHIIQFKEVFLTPQYLGICMEYAEGGDLFQYVKKRGGLREHEARWFFQQLIIAIDYSHRMGIVNRDIKLENTLLDGSRRPLVKICDFGYSKHLRQDSLPKSKVGTPGYTAPEIISRSNPHNYDGKSVDVWSAGVMLYVMLFCKYPFERKGDDRDPAKFQKILERIQRVEYEFPPQVPISRDCRDLLCKILVADPTRRITIAGIQQHPWYRTDLPPALDNFNASCIRNQNRGQDGGHGDKIQAIVNQAKFVGGAGGASGLLDAQDDGDGDYEVDTHIDELMSTVHPPTVA